jgi:hypothetical protein
VVAEVKSFRDRGPMTEPSRVDSAMGQLAVGRAAVAQMLPEAATSGVLVMAGPGKGFRAHRLELSRWDRHLRLLWPALAAGVSRARALTQRGVRLDDAAVWAGVPKRWSPNCPGSCALANVCRAELVAVGAIEAAGADIPQRLGFATTNEYVAWVDGTAEPVDAGAAAVASTAQALEQYDPAMNGIGT